MAGKPKKVRVDDKLLKDYLNGNLDTKLSIKVEHYLEKNPNVLKRVSQLSHDTFAKKIKKVAAPHSDSSALPEQSFDSSNLAQAFSPTNVPPELQAYTGHHILKELGRGGMGVVYLAKTPPPLERHEVLKVLNERLLHDESARQRFMNEIAALGQLNDTKNFVVPYSAFFLGRLLVLVMEYVNGIDLHKYLQRQGPLPISRACSFASQIASGLQHAYEKGLVHRDIKPSNVMVFKLDQELRIKILDLGLAKATGKDLSRGLTGAGMALGTPEYMAPEQTMDAATTDIRADIYSLGCTLYHMLVGAPPFEGTIGEVMMAHAQIAPTDVHLMRSEVPAGLSELISKMMAKDPQQRFQQPFEVCRALKGYMDDSAMEPPAQPGRSEAPATLHAFRAPDVETSVVHSQSPVGSQAGDDALREPIDDQLAAIHTRDRIPGLRTTQDHHGQGHKHSVAKKFKRRLTNRLLVTGTLVSAVAVLLVFALVLSTGSQDTAKQSEDQTDQATETDPPSPDTDEAATADSATDSNSITGEANSADDSAVEDTSHSTASDSTQEDTVNDNNSSTDAIRLVDYVEPKQLATKKVRLGRVPIDSREPVLIRLLPPNGTHSLAKVFHINDDRKSTDTWSIAFGARSSTGARMSAKSVNAAHLQLQDTKLEMAWIKEPTDFLSTGMANYLLEVSQGATSEIVRFRESVKIDPLLMPSTEKPHTLTIDIDHAPRQQHIYVSVEKMEGLPATKLMAGQPDKIGHRDSVKWAFVSNLAAGISVDWTIRGNSLSIDASPGFMLESDGKNRTYALSLETINSIETKGRRDLAKAEKNLARARNSVSPLNQRLRWARSLPVGNDVGSRGYRDRHVADAQAAINNNDATIKRLGNLIPLMNSDIARLPALRELASQLTADSRMTFAVFLEFDNHRVTLATPRDSNSAD